MFTEEKRPRHNKSALLLYWGPDDTIGVQSSLFVCPFICPSLCLSLCLSVSLSLSLDVHIAFWPSKRTAHNCAQRLLPQATWSNPLSCSIICPSVGLSVHPWIFCDFIFVLCSVLWGGGSVAMHLLDRAKRSQFEKPLLNRFFY